MADTIEIKDLSLIGNLKDTDSVLIADNDDGVAKRATIQQIKNELLSESGTSNHAQLDNLLYENSGHVGLRLSLLLLKLVAVQLILHGIP